MRGLRLRGGARITATAVLRGRLSRTLNTSGLARAPHDVTAAPLVRLHNAHIPGPACGNNTPSLTWTVHDGGADECWAIIGPSGGTGGAVRRAIVEVSVYN